jgi:hypothetical protein
MVVMFVDCCVGVYGTFRTIPTVENLRGGPNPYSRIPVKLAQSSLIKVAHICTNRGIPVNRNYFLSQPLDIYK